MYPKVSINLKGVVENYQKIKELGNKRNIQIGVVTKLLSDNKEIVTALVNEGAECICESKIANLISYQDLEAEKWLIRLPGLSEIKEVVQYADVSLNSELVTIKALNEEAQKQNKIHKVVLMYELGDLREGCMKEDLKQIIRECINLQNIEIYGLGVNLSCYGEIMPTEENMCELVKVAEELEEEFSIRFKVISGGNSSSYRLMEEGKLPSRINHLRIGESIYLGTIPCIGEDVKELHQDNFILKAQIIELKEKPSVPWGEPGKCNSLGENTTFIDRGIRKRAIIGLGRQDVKIDAIRPLDKDIILLGGSSDHIIFDVTDSTHDYQVGDVLKFQLNYAGVLSVMTSKYVQKEIEK